MSTIAILSDTHDQIANLRAAISYCNANTVTKVIHCGDLISPFMLKELANFSGETHLIYGNNAGDQHLISSRCGDQFPTIIHHGIMGDIHYCGLHIGFVHYPEMAIGLASQELFDVVCCGHDHQYHIRQYGKTMLLNPGSLLGDDDQAGFMVLDCTTRATQRVRVGESMFYKEIKVWAE